MELEILSIIKMHINSFTWKKHTTFQCPTLTTVINLRACMCLDDMDDTITTSVRAYCIHDTYVNYIGNE